MKKKIFIGFLLALVVILAAKTMIIKVAKVELRSQNTYLSDIVMTLEKGEKVQVIEETPNGWYQVKSESGKSGYIHPSALEKVSANLTGVIPGQKGVKGDEVALAAKGFNESVEKKVRGDAAYNFHDLEWVMKQKVSMKSLKEFVGEGRLK